MVDPVLIAAADDGQSFEREAIAAHFHSFLCVRRARHLHPRAAPRSRAHGEKANPRWSAANRTCESWQGN